MHDLATNPLIIIAVASVITNFGLVFAAGANYINKRTEMLKMGLQIAELQRQQTHLATMQQTNSTPTIINVPTPTIAQPAAGPTGLSGPTVAPGGPYSVR